MLCTKAHCPLRRRNAAVGTHDIRQVQIAVPVLAGVAAVRLAEKTFHLLDFLLPGGGLLVFPQHFGPGDAGPQAHHVPEDIAVLGAYAGAAVAEAVGSQTVVQRRRDPLFERRRSSWMKATIPSTRRQRLSSHAVSPVNSA